MRSTIISLFLATCLLAQNSNPKVFSLDAQKIFELRSSYQKGELKKNISIKKIITASEKLLSMDPVSVTQKGVVPPSGDKHDYMSMSKYWWPDPTKPDGLPYINRDGEVNPETKEIADASNVSKIISSIEMLSITSYLTNDARFSAKASQLLRVWFLDAESRMNPNLNYAQYVKGKNEGTKSGIIDIHGFYRIIDAIGLLEQSKEWTYDDDVKIKKWFEEFLLWLQTSKNGSGEALSKNNHGSWYDVQVASIALFLGQSDLAKTTLENVKSKRIDSQIKSDGKQPFELVRTTSWDYSVFNLMALIQLAKLGDKVGVDLWNYTNPEGGSIRKALDYILPYSIEINKWEYKQIKEISVNRIYPLLNSAKLKYDSAIYDEWIQKIFGDKNINDLSNLL